MKLDEQEEFFKLFDELQYNRSDNIAKTLPDEIDDFIIDKIKDALKENNNNQTRASHCLGIKRTTFVHMCKRLKIF